MIVFSEKTIAVWYIALIPGEQDFMGSFYIADDGELEFTYRFRYYHSDDPYDKKDKKSWYRVRLKKDNPEKQTQAQMLTNIRYLVHKLEQISGQKADEILYQGDYKKFLDEIKSKPWAYMRKATPEDVGLA